VSGWCQLISRLFNNTFSKPRIAAKYGYESWIGENVEGSDHDLYIYI
jgi:hypothetical protein